MMAATRYPFLWLIRFYQYSFARLVPPGTCRFEPSCSNYAYEAFDRHGVFRGAWLTLRRLSRCRPGGGLGYDPVPERDGT